MTLAAVLLAGGESRRMGRDKAGLPLQGAPLWRRQLDILRGLAPDILLVSGRSRPEWLAQDVAFVPDAVPSRGPLSGLAAALAAISQTHLLALAVDMPLMSEAHLSELWLAALPGCGVLPEIAGEPEYLPAIYPMEAAPLAANFLACGEVSLKHFTAALADRGLLKKFRVQPADERLYANCNSPADWHTYVSPTTA